LARWNKYLTASRADAVRLRRIQGVANTIARRDRVREAMKRRDPDLRAVLVKWGWARPPRAATLQQTPQAPQAPQAPVIGINKDRLLEASQALR
jgi:hypothetical protein